MKLSETIAAKVCREVLRCAVLLGVCVAPLHAQFSGPSLQTGSINTPVSPTTDPAVLYPADKAIQIMVGDSLTVHLYDVPNFTTPERVGLDGSLQIPLIGSVPVLGLTLHQAADLIAERLKTAGMYTNPQVTMQLTDSPNQVVTVSGEMHGVIPVLGRRGLFSVLSAAGQFPATASHTIIINRPDVRQPIVVDLGTDPARSARADVPVFAGDTVVVPRTGVIYLLGSFRNSGAFPLQQNSPLTLMQATALGGGVLFEANYKDLRIVRTVGNERLVVKTDIQAVMHGKVPDPILQADDIVYLPSTFYKALVNNGGFGAINSIVSLILVALGR